MSGPRHRLAYIDWARGIAVLLMVEAHTLDAWTRATARRGAIYRDAVVLGGFAAPLFLWLAGLSVALAASAIVNRGANRRAAADAVCRRGLEVFILAFLFRLQAFIVSPGGHPITLFRVDILNIMGPAIVAAGLVWLLVESPARLALTYASLATVIAMTSPLVRTMAAVDRLPVWLQWYVRPAGEHTTFTAFPWAGFVFAGAAIGTVLANARERRHLLSVIGLAGAALVWLGIFTASRPAIYAQASFWTSSPTYFAIRVGVMMITLAVLYACEQLASRYGVSLPALELFGRRSLFVYWIHVELVYGYASWPIRGRLPLWGVAIAYGVFTVLLYGAAVAFDRWQQRRRHSTTQITLQRRAEAVT
jgi:uncharacterized membrane protein